MPYYIDLKSNLNDVHQKLVDAGGNIGVSFPMKSFQTAGPIIRLHSSDLDSLKRVADNKQVSIDHNLQHNFAVRVKTLNFSKLRRFIKRNPDATEEMLANFNKKIMGSYVQNTFVNMSSSSTGQNYKLFLKFNTLKFDEAMRFNSFGLLQKLKLIN